MRLSEVPMGACPHVDPYEFINIIRILFIDYSTIKNLEIYREIQLFLKSKLYIINGKYLYIKILN